MFNLFKLTLTRSIDEYLIASIGVGITDITLMIDLDSKASYLTFLTQIRALGMIKVRYHYLFVTFVRIDIGDNLVLI